MTPSSSFPDPPEFGENSVIVDRNNKLTATASGANALPPQAPKAGAENYQNPARLPEVTGDTQDEEMIDVPSTPEVSQMMPQSESNVTCPVTKAPNSPGKLPLKRIEPPKNPESRSVTKAAKPRRKPPSKPKKLIEPPATPEPLPNSSKTPNQAPNVSEDVDPAEFMARLDGWVREYQHLPAPRPLEASSESLAAYAAQSKEERMAIIDDLICECLGDENFTKLVEDVSDSWRRIGLGL